MTYEMLVYATLASGAFGLLATVAMMVLDCWSRHFEWCAYGALVGLAGFAIGLVAMIHFAA